MVLDGSFEADLLQIDAGSLAMRNSIRGVNLKFQCIHYYFWGMGDLQTPWSAVHCCSNPCRIYIALPATTLHRAL